MKVKARIPALSLLVFIAPAISGCVTPTPVRGWIPAIQPGTRAEDFEYVDQEGNVCPFRKILGDYTVLAFTRCDKDMHGPATRLLERILAENSQAWYAEVVAVDVHWSPEGCADHSGCHLISEIHNLVSLCDARGTVRRLYGITGADGLYVIGPENKVIASAPFDDATALRQQLRADVSYLSEQREEDLEPR